MIQTKVQREREREREFLCVAQVGLELLSSSESPVSAS
jgi:hypothetical protein